MVKLRMDFIADWHEYLREELAKIWGGPKAKAIPEEDLAVRYFDSPRRAIEATPRQVRISDVFSVPAGYEAGWSLLKGKITSGEDLRPHLSKDHLKPNNRDGLLNEWGIHHFHLGQSPSRTNARLIERTGPLVLAYVSKEVFYAIGVYDHEPPPWSNSELVEILHRNWPEAIEQYRVSGVSAEVITEEARESIRKKRAFTFTATLDGTVYSPLSGGIVTSGQVITSVISADVWEAEIRQIQEACLSNCEKLIEGIRSTGAHVEGEVSGKLVFTEPNYAVLFPQYRTLGVLDWPNNY